MQRDLEHVQQRMQCIRVRGDLIIYHVIAAHYTPMVEYPKTVMLDYRAIAVDISFELIPIVFARLARRATCISTGIFRPTKLSRILVGRTHRTDGGVRINRAYNAVLILLTSGSRLVQHYDKI